MDTKENRDKDRPADLLTERSQEKAKEDRRYVPVIVKRTDEVKRHPDDTLEHAIREGLEQLNRPSLSLFISSIAAGLVLGFSVMAVGIVQAYFEVGDVALTKRLLTAFAYPLGFVVCVMSGTELFTEHTATAVYPVLDRRSSGLRLARLWSLVLLGNLVGAYFSAILLKSAEPVIGATQGYIAIGHHLLHFEATTLFASALLAGWLMAQGAWLVMSTPPNLAQIVCIYLVTFLIGLGGLHHAIAGSIEMFLALLVSDDFTIGQAARFIVIAVLGNTVGGAGFVALLNHSHVRSTRTLTDTHQA